MDLGHSQLERFLPKTVVLKNGEIGATNGNKNQNLWVKYNICLKFG